MCSTLTRYRQSKWTSSSNWYRPATRKSWSRATRNLRSPYRSSRRRRRMPVKKTYWAKEAMTSSLLAQRWSTIKRKCNISNNNNNNNRRMYWRGRIRERSNSNSNKKKISRCRLSKSHKMSTRSSRVSARMFLSVESMRNQSTLLTLGVWRNAMSRIPKNICWNWWCRSCILRAALEKTMRWNSWKCRNWWIIRGTNFPSTQTSVTTTSSQ